MSQKVVLSSISSDSHIWNLIYLQLLLESMEFDVVNLGASVATEDILKMCHRHLPSHLVISTVNGHGYLKGIEIIREIKKMNLLKNMSVVIGGKLGVNGVISDTQIQQLYNEGFDGVFVKDTAIDEFKRFMVSGSCVMKAI